MPMRLYHWLLPAALCLLSLSAKAEYFNIVNYDVNVKLSSDGYADFEEIIEVEFTTSRHGIFRQIPLRSEINGRSVTRIIRDIEVDGFNFSTSKENQNLILKIGSKNTWVEGRQTYRIRYRVLNPLNFFEEHAEFYWDLLGISWPVVTRNFSFNIELPGGIRLSKEDVQYYTGYDGYQGSDAVVDVAANQITGRTNREFSSGEAVTIAVKLPRYAFKEMDYWTAFRLQHSLLLVPFFFLAAGWAALRRARNPTETIMVEYFPPEGLSPAIVGGFVDHAVDQNDVLCLIPHLANQGYLRLEMEEKSGLFGKNKITFYKLKEAGDELFPFEEKFFNALFSTGDVVELEDLKDKFYMHIAAVQIEVKSWIKAQGWYQADQGKWGFGVGFAGLAALGWGLFAVFARQNLDGIALIITGIVLFIFATQFNKRTPAGNESYRHMEGFRLFVKKAERPVIERLMQDDPLYYDKTMPFALAFGYLKQWNAHFDGLLSQPPSWYGGTGVYGHNATDSWTNFSESFPKEVNQIGSVFNSSPSSSSSGGGGGSSGGGSGGGGGGSW
jgi:uncharacterized membrane protein